MDAATLTRAIRWTVGLSVSRDVRAETLAMVRVQRPIVAGLRIAVLGSAPGVGATTVASVLALVLAHYRADRILAVDADPDGAGALARRVGGGGLPGGPANLRLRAGDADGSRFGVCVTDAGASAFGPAPDTAVLTGAHRRLLVVPATPEGTARRRRRWSGTCLTGHPAPPTDVVPVFRHGTFGTGGAAHVDRLAAAVGRYGVGTFPVPYDRVLAGGGTIRASAVGEASRHAFVALAAAVLRPAPPAALAVGRAPAQQAVTPAGPAMRPAGPVVGVAGARGVAAGPVIGAGPAAGGARG